MTAPRPRGTATSHAAGDSSAGHRTTRDCGHDTVNRQKSTHNQKGNRASPEQAERQVLRERRP
jgi:hypothetical protein